MAKDAAVRQQLPPRVMAGLSGGYVAMDRASWWIGGDEGHPMRATTT
jgi:hypothetical protein